MSRDREELRPTSRLGPSNRAWLVLLFVEKEKVERRAVFERSRVLEIPSIKLLLRGEVRAGKVM